jgi:hypothetical protein
MKSLKVEPLLDRLAKTFSLGGHPNDSKTMLKDAVICMLLAADYSISKEQNTCGTARQLVEKRAKACNWCKTSDKRYLSRCRCGQVKACLDCWQ